MAITAGAAADKAAINKEAKYRKLANQQPHLYISCHRDSWDLEQPSSGNGAGAGPTNDSRH